VLFELEMNVGNREITFGYVRFDLSALLTLFICSNL